MTGEPGHFTVEILKHPRFIIEDKCIACGICADKCPKKIIDTYNVGLSKRKAAYVEYAQAVPLKYAIDPDNCIYVQKGKCGACKKFCESEAIDFDQKETIETLEVGAVVLSPGFEPFDPSDFDTYKYADHPNVITAMEMEQIRSALAPTGGHRQSSALFSCAQSGSHL